MKYLLAAVVALFASQAWAADRSVSVSGHGYVEVVPDIASIEIRIATESNNVKTAVKDNADKTKSVLAFLEDIKVDKSDICTHGFSVYHPYENNKVSTDWMASNHILVTVKDISKAGEIISGVSKNNAVQVDGVRFIVSDSLRDSVVSKAREMAMKDAMKRAALYAKTAGATLGDVTSISEQGSRNPYAFEAMTSSSRRADSPGGSMPLSAGKTKITIEVSTTFSLK